MKRIFKAIACLIVALLPVILCMIGMSGLVLLWLMISIPVGLILWLMEDEK